MGGILRYSIVKASVSLGTDFDVSQDLVYSLCPNISIIKNKTMYWYYMKIKNLINCSTSCNKTCEETRYAIKSLQHNKGNAEKLPKDIMQ